MNRKVVCIDISNIVPGKGGSGGGIATYAFHLLVGLDSVAARNEIKIICLKSSEFLSLGELTNIRVKNVSAHFLNPFIRFLWVQLFVPLFCLRNSVNILHRLTPEMPFIKVCKYFCTVHDLMFDYYFTNGSARKYLSINEVIKCFILRIIAWISVRRASCIIVPSYSIMNELGKKFSGILSKVHMIYEASEIENVQIDLALRGKEVLQIGVIAGFYPHKGHLKVLELAGKMISCGFDAFHIHFRGNPGYKRYLEDVIAAVKASSVSRVFSFVPFEDRARLENIYSRFDVLVLLSDYEGFGLPVIEAQARGLPVFCSDILVFREILGDSAFYIPNEIDSLLLKNLIATFCDKKILLEYSRRGYINAKRFSWADMASSTYNLYLDDKLDK